VIDDSQNPSHHALASRALVRARLRQWDTALTDAEMVCIALLSHALILISIYSKAIKIQSSVVGYVAKSMALVGNGESHEAYRTCDIAFERFHSSHSTFLLLIKVCISRTSFPLNRLPPLGYRRVYGWRAPRGDITSRPADC